MGPESDAVMCSAIPLKELSWIDRMYQKLENICVEVDKNPTLLIQETSKYVESQMTVVGCNVKKLCAELIHDLLPPPVEKNFDCPLHCKCDCANMEKPKQKEVIIQPFKETESARTEDNIKGFDAMHHGDIELKNLVSIQMSKLNIDVNNTMIKNDGKKLTKIIIEDGEQLAQPAIVFDTHLQGNERDGIFVSKVSISKEYGKHDDISKEEHVGGDNRSHAGNMPMMQMDSFGSWEHEYGSDEEFEVKAKPEDICGRDTVVHNGERDRSMYEVRNIQSEMEREEAETTVALLRCSNLSIMETTSEGPDRTDTVGERFVSDMDDDAIPSYGSTASTKSGVTDVKSMYSSTESLKSAGENLDERLCLGNINNCNRHRGSPQGGNYMMMLASNDGDEEQSARWLVSESQRNIFQHHENPSFHKGVNHLEEFESDWELV